MEYWPCISQTFAGYVKVSSTMTDGRLTGVANVTGFTALHRSRRFSSEVMNVAIQCFQGKCHENITTPDTYMKTNSKIHLIKIRFEKD
jgi:hypothetical protein